MNVPHLIQSLWRSKTVTKVTPGERVVMASVVSDVLATYFGMLLYSLQRHNPWFSVPVRVLYGQQYGALSKSNRELLSSIYSNLEFVPVDEGRYEHLFKNTPEYIRPSLFKFECFGMCGPEDVVFIDADILCLGDISEVFSTRVPFGASPPGPEREAKAKGAGRFRRTLGLNAGVLMIGHEYRTKKMYDFLTGHDGVGNFADQHILNDYFRYVPIYCLHHRYNYHAEFFWDKYGDVDDVRLLHYAGKKPREAPDMPRMRPWLEEAERAGHDCPAIKKLMQLPVARTWQV